MAEDWTLGGLNWTAGGHRRYEESYVLSINGWVFLMYFIVVVNRTVYLHVGIMPQC